MACLDLAARSLAEKSGGSSILGLVACVAAALLCEVLASITVQDSGKHYCARFWQELGMALFSVLGMALSMNER